MRYAINFDKTINQLVPCYLGGRRLILFLQSCIKPLQKINEQFVEYAKETRIETSMTSQILPFEWFLNRKFRKYFEDPKDLISIKNGEKLGVPVYNESASDIEEDDELKLWFQSESAASPANPAFYHSDELTNGSSHSFLVYIPKLWEQTDKNGNPTGQLRDGITIDQFKSMVAFWIEKYRVAGKSYKIIINNQ